MAETNLLLLGAPRMPFTAKELTEVRQYIEAGGSALVIMHEGGEGGVSTSYFKNLFIKKPKKKIGEPPRLFNNTSTPLPPPNLLNTV